MLMQITEKELGATKYNKNIVQYLFAAIIIISFITMALTASLVLKDSSNIWLNITFIALLLSIFVAVISVWG